MKIYTKKGDRGQTHLFDGSRVRKDDLRVEAYGTLDELSAFIGAAASWLKEDAELFGLLADIQRDLLRLGAQLADPREQPQAGREMKSRLDPGRIAALEKAIDTFETELPPLRQFILAGGSHAGALLHVSRTICRRAERRVTGLAAEVQIHASAIEYLNRLSDFLFVLARLVNHRQGQQEILW